MTDSRSQPGITLVQDLRMDAEMLKDGHQKNLTELWHSDVVQQAARNSAAAAERIAELEGRLRMILAKTEGERHTVNEQNVFKYWDLLNLMMVEIRDIARAAMSRSRTPAVSK